MFADSRGFRIENQWLEQRRQDARIVLRSDSVSSLYSATAAGVASRSCRVASPTTSRAWCGSRRTRAGAARGLADGARGSAAQRAHPGRARLPAEHPEPSHAQTLSGGGGRPPRHQSSERVETRMSSKDFVLCASRSLRAQRDYAVLRRSEQRVRRLRDPLISRPSPCPIAQCAGPSGRASQRSESNNSRPA